MSSKSWQTLVPGLWCHSGIYLPDWQYGCVRFDIILSWLLGTANTNVRDSVGSAELIWEPGTTEAYLGTSIVKNARLWLVGLDGGNVDDGAALLHVLHSMLRNSEVGEDVCVECAFQAFSADFLKLVDLLVLESSIVD